MILTDDEINAVMERAEAAWLADKERTLDFDIVAGRAIESAVLEKLRAGVELPDMRDSGYSVDGIEIKTLTYPQLFAYGDARALAGREQAIEECAQCMEEQDTQAPKYNARAIRALAASPQEQT